MGIGILIVVPIVSVLYLPGEAVLGLVGLIPAIGGGWCWWKTSHGQHGQALLAFAVTAVVFLTAIFGFASLRVDHHQNARPMMAAIRADYESSKEGKGKTKARSKSFPFVFRTAGQGRCSADRHLRLLPRKHRILCRASRDHVR